MPFNQDERQRLLALKGVGPTVVARLEQAGFDVLAQLAPLEAEELASLIGGMLGSRCWQTSPMARNSLRAVIRLARGEDN